MATLILTDGTTISGSTTEVAAILASVRNSVTVTPVDNRHADKVAARAISARPNKPNSDGIKASVCGHTISRTGAGRPPKYCEACKGANKRQAPQNGPQAPQKGESGRKHHRTATTDVEKVRAQVLRYANFACSQGLITDHYQSVCKEAARVATKFEALAGVKKALSAIITDAKLWPLYMEHAREARANS